MSLTLKHFDTRLNQWLHTNSSTDNQESVLEEKLDNTLLEFFLPNKEFSFGQMDEYSTATDLKNHPEDHELLFSSKSRLLYGEPESLEVINKLCPDRKDRGAYGSIFLGACKNAVHEKLNILVVDDVTGENGGVLENEEAWKLVGDCYGQVSPQLYDNLTKRQGEEDYRVIQHRFGWRESDGDDNQYRFGKGTLRPYKLEQLVYADPGNEPQIDLILPLSSFKGTDKDNPRGAEKPQIKPGLYNQTIWLGEKSQSQQGQTAISQLLASFPQGIKDFVEELELQAQKLTKIQSDPRKVAQLYCETYEKRKEIQESKRQEQEAKIAATKNQTIAIKDEQQILSVDVFDSDIENQNEVEPDRRNGRTELEDLFMYKLIKADLQGHCQMLETEKVKQELSRFVQNQWRDIAIGRTLTFDRAMIIPSKELKNGEIYVPWFDQGEKVLNFRSPFLNSNGLCVSVNKRVDDYVGPDGKDLKGIIIVNDEDHKRIQARIEALQAEGKHLTETAPAETESERQGRDFDGDCIGVAKAKDYPTLTAEAEYRNLPENAYAPTTKLKKQSFYREDGTQPEFEEIAIFMSDSISVGVINNQVTALEALESEIAILQTHGTLSQQSEYLDTVANHYQKLFAQENDEKNPKPIEAEYRERMQEIVSLASVRAKTPQLVEQALSINRSIYRDIIEFGCFQNQIAVDMFKSARAPEMDIIKENKRYLYRDVNYIKDKKLASAYLTQGIIPSGYSPVELLVNQANQYFQVSQLESRPIVQFADLFKGVEFTPQQKFTATLAKLEFDQKFNEATRLDKRRQTDRGPYAIVQTTSGTSIEITNLTRYGHPAIWNANTLNLKLEEIPQYQRRPDRPHKLLAVAQINGEMEDGKPKYRPLGTVNQQSAIDHQLKAGMTTNGATVVQLKPELQESQIKLLFQQAQNVAKDFYSNIPESQRLSAAAAAWSVAASRQDEVERTANTTTEQADNSQKKLSNFIFAAFPNEIVSRLNELQFNNLKLTNLNQAVSSPHSLHDIEIKTDAAPERIEPQLTRSVFIKDSDGEYKLLGTLEQRTGKLPIGTKAQASVVPGDTYTATATIASPGNPPVEFIIREISKFSHAGQTFNGEQVTLAIANTQVPTDTVRIKLDGKVLGELDSDSISELKKVNYLENNRTLNLKLKSIGSTAEPGGFIIAESPKGNLLRINKVSYYDFKGQHFNDATPRNVTLELPPYKSKTAVFLDNKLLGVLHYNKDKEALKQLGLLKPTGSSFVSCQLQSNYSHSYLMVDPATIQYPKTWVKGSAALKDTTQQSVVSPTQAMIDYSAPFLSKLKERLTVLFSSAEDKMLGLAGLAVDNNKLPVVQQWLESKGIEFNQVPKPEAPTETRKGLAVLYLNTNTVAPQDLAALQTKFGNPLDANGSNSPYHQHLQSLPNRPHKQNGEASALIDSPSSSAQAASLETTVTNNSVIATNSPDAIASVTTVATPSGVADTNLDTLRQWYVAAKELNRPQDYLDSITFVANEFKQGKALPTEAISVMQADIGTYNQQLSTVEKLNQLNDHDLIQLQSSVSNYFKDAPTQPPNQIDKQIVKDEISLLNTRVESLSKKQQLQLEQVKLLKNDLFGTWNQPYKEAVTQLEQTQNLLLRFRARIDQHEAQLQHWVKQSEVYQAWQNNPQTHQMKELNEVLSLPQMQERIANTQLQQQQFIQQPLRHRANRISH